MQTGRLKIIKRVHYIMFQTALAQGERRLPALRYRACGISAVKRLYMPLRVERLRQGGGITRQHSAVKRPDRLARLAI